MRRSRILNKFSLAIYIFFHNYIIGNYLIMPYFYKHFNQNVWICFVITAILSIVMGLLISNKKLKINILKKVKDLKIIKYIMSLFFIANIILILVLATKIISLNYDVDVHYIVFLIPILVASVYISKIGSVGIINMISWPILFLIPIVLYSFFSNNNIRNIYELLPIDFNFSKFGYVLLGLYLILNNYIFIFLNQDIEKPFTRKFFILSNFFSLLILGLMSILIITMLGSNYLSYKDFFGLSIFDITYGFKYIDSFAFISIFVVTMSSVCSLGINFDFLFKVNNIKKNFKIGLTLIVLIVSYVLLNYFSYFLKNIHFILYGLIGCLFIFYIYILTSKGDKDEVI